MSLPRPLRSRLSDAGRAADVGRVALLGACLGAGALAAAAFTGAAPAAPNDCVPVLGCVSTPLPSVPVPTVPLPGVPALPTTTGSPPPPAGTTTTTPATTTTNGPGATDSDEIAEAAFSATASVRARRRGARRVVEIRIRLTKDAGLSAILSRNRRTVGLRRFVLHSGSRMVLLPVRRTTKAGPVKLSLAFRTAAGEVARATYRLRLPR